jgi:hypothetical protein
VDDADGEAEADVDAEAEVEAELGSGKRASSRVVEDEGVDDDIEDAIDAAERSSIASSDEEKDG